MIRRENWRHVAAALSHRDHKIFNATLLPALICLWAQRTGIAWLAWDLTHSPTWLGVVAAADLLPAVIISPLAGVVADRVNAVWMMRITQGIIGLHACVLGLMTAFGTIEIWSLFAMALITGMNQPFSTSARMVFYPTLVPKRDLGSAIAINSSIFNLGRVLGPAIAGALIAPFGVEVLFFVTAVAFIGHFINMFRVKGVFAEESTRVAKSFLGEIRDGLGYAINHPGIRPMLILMVVTSGVGRAFPEMLPGFADVVFGRGAQGLGWLLASMGAGGLIGAVWLAQRGPVQGLTSTVVALTLVMGAATTGFALIQLYWAALAFAVVIGFTHSVTGTGAQALLQTAVAPELRGRVMSIFTLVTRGFPAIGAIAVGAIAELAGLAWTIAGTGVIMGLAWGTLRASQHRMAAALESGVKP
jgi:predicted MFS family arabinose efflux permease